ncbi:hypothetical protein BDP27DRAFT_1312059, partial [Rhodocollybia butyracea]
MEPLYDLAQIENWKYYMPSSQGYLPPARIKGLEKVREGLQEYTGDLRLYSLPMTMLFTVINPPHPGIKIDKDFVSIPLPVRDFKEFRIHGQDILEFPSSRIQVQNPHWEKFIGTNAIRSLYQMQIKTFRPPKLILHSFTIQTGKVLHSTRTEQSASNGRHFASIIVILPSHSTAITLSLKYGNFSAAQSFTLVKDLLFCNHVYTFYTGIGTLDIRSQDHFCYFTYHLFAHEAAPTPMLSGITPVVPELRDLFRDWRARRFAGDQVPPFVLVMFQQIYSGREGLCEKDEFLLRHLAPLARAYGFRMEIVNLKNQETSEHRFQDKRKEYVYNTDLGALAEELKMENGDNYRTNTWVTGFRDLGNNSIQSYDKSILRAIERDIVTGAYISHHGMINAQIPLRDADIPEDTMYEMTVSLTHTRILSFLMIRPEELDMNEGEAPRFLKAAKDVG